MLESEPMRIKKRGPAPKPADQRRRNAVRALVTDEENRKILRAAQVARLTVSEYVRSCLVQGL